MGPEIERSLEELRHTYKTRTDDPILSYGGFYERFTPELVEFLHQAVLLALARFRHGPGNHLKEKVAHLADILVQDSTGKPMGFAGLRSVVGQIAEFWFHVAELPR